QVRAEDRQAMNAQFVDLPAGRNRTTQTGYFLVHDSSLRPPLLLLGFFDDDAFVRITHTLALVGLGLAVSADLGGLLAHFLQIGSADDDFRRSGTLGTDTLGQLMLDVVRETKLQFDD